MSVVLYRGENRKNVPLILSLMRNRSGVHAVGMIDDESGGARG